MCKEFLQGKLNNSQNNSAVKKISYTQVSRFAAVVDEEAGKFKQRTLGAYTYAYLDAQYAKIYMKAALDLVLF